MTNIIFGKIYDLWQEKEKFGETKAKLVLLRSRVARWYIFKPKIPL
jgi:hypothetical protein